MTSTEACIAVIQAALFLGIDSLAEKGAQTLTSRLALDNCVHSYLFATQTELGELGTLIQTAAWQYILRHVLRKASAQTLRACRSPY